MFRGPVRIAVLIVGLVLTAGAAYRAYDDEAALTRVRQEAAAAEAAAGKATELLLDIRAALHAYVAPGQGLPFWAKRAQEDIDNLRQTLVSLDAMAAPFSQSLSESLDAIDQMTAAERRARTYVSREDMLLAGDVVFTEVRDLLAATTTQVDTVRAELKRRYEQRASVTRTEQITLVGGLLALWIVIAMFLTPTEAKPTAKDPAQWRSELKETLSKPAAPTPAALVAAAPEAVVAPAAPLAPQAPSAPQAPLAPQIQLSSVREASEICADLSALSDPGALHGTLARVSALLDATGLIVWIASNDGASLTPVATHGFDEALVARIGRVSRDSANLTAAAFRDTAPKVSPATATAPAALAVVMYGPSGPAGVLSIEMKPRETVDEGKVALASIIAAQLSTLTMPLPDLQGHADLPQSAAI
jgi:hypothetical protein